MDRVVYLLTCKLIVLMRVMDAETRGASPMLLAANQRLHMLRGQRMLAGERPFFATAVSEPASPAVATTVATVVVALPAHLGWGSAAVTQVVRESRGAEERESGDNGRQTAVCNAMRTESAGEQGDNSVGGSGRETVKHYPSLGVAALGAKETATLRVWLACRSMDGAGRGWLASAAVRAHLTVEGAPLHLCSWRRLRQVLRQGNGRFWTWQGDRLWLHGAARVAASLGVTTLAGRPVELPLTALTAGIGPFRAHLYAAWHSGRRSANPIARASQRHHLHVSERSQRRYCQQLGVKRRRHFALGRRCSRAALEERAWQQGTATFEFVDSLGKFGTLASYVAWQLPNSYGRRHQPSRMGRQKKLQRQLTDLVNQGARGNSETIGQRQYHPNGKAAAQAARAGKQKPIYWPADQAHDWQIWLSLEIR